jgi:hypothetical protein
MKHPTNEEWVTHLYGETTPSEGQQLNQHLKRCDKCRTQWEAWKSCQPLLGKTPQPSDNAVVWQLTRWAAAACIVLGLTYFAGYNLGQKQAIPNHILTELRQEILKEIPPLQARELSTLRLDLENRIAEHLQNTDQTIKIVRQEAAAGRRQLRLELETVALIGESRYQLSKNQHQAHFPGLQSPQKK